MMVGGMCSQSLPSRQAGTGLPPKPLLASGTIPHGLEFESRLDFGLKGRRLSSAW